MIRDNKISLLNISLQANKSFYNVTCFLRFFKLKSKVELWKLVIKERNIHYDSWNAWVKYLW